MAGVRRFLRKSLRIRQDVAQERGLRGCKNGTRQQRMSHPLGLAEASATVQPFVEGLPGNSQMRGGDALVAAGKPEGLGNKGIFGFLQGRHLPPSTFAGGRIAEEGERVGWRGCPSVSRNTSEGV